MEYGLWNLHGGFWAGNNPCASGDRSTYTSVNAAGGIETAVFPNAASSPPCRSSYRGQPEYVAMKPTESVPTIPTRTAPASSAVLPSLHGDLISQQNSHGGGINTMPMNANSAHPSNAHSPPEPNTNTLNKKGKPSKSSHKRSGITKPDNAVPVQYFNQQYTPMYSMMFGRTPMKRPDATSDESDDDDEDDNNANDADTYSNESSTVGNQSPQRGGISRSGYECGQCDLVAETRPALKKHIGQCHPGPAADAHLAHALHHKASGCCPMPTCGFRSLSRDDLEAHIARHVADGFQRHSSSSSSAAARKRASAISLQRVRYEREEYRCQVCSYTCTIEKAFYKHLKLHSIGLNVPSVKISCVICGKDRPSEVEMNKHMRKHRDNRYFCCDVCIFRTVQLKKLIQHRRMHTGEKPHLCPHCAYRSARRDNLRSHVRRVHKKENLYCDTFSPRGLLPSSAAAAGQEVASPDGSQQ